MTSIILNYRFDSIAAEQPTSFVQNQNVQISQPVTGHLLRLPFFGAIQVPSNASLMRPLLV